MFSALEILYIAIAFGALIIAVAFVWFLFRVSMVLKGVADVIGELKGAVARLEQSLNGIKARFEHGTSHLGKMTEHMKDAASKWGAEAKDSAMNAKGKAMNWTSEHASEYNQAAQNKCKEVCKGCGDMCKKI